MAGQNEKDDLTMLRHDINNQLSNIQLCLAQLRHEMSGQTEDCNFYIDTIAVACKKIESLLKNPER
ncbi:MAG: hypothetical protein ABIN95_03685 [Mucilaginibacter sp.]